jgi:hypothetical protein
MASGISAALLEFASAAELPPYLRSADSRFSVTAEYFPDCLGFAPAQFDVYRRDLRDIVIGATRYPLRVEALHGFATPAPDGGRSQFRLEEISFIMGIGDEVSDAITDWTDNFHVLAQTLMSKRPFEMNATERRQWESISSYVDIAAYHNNAPTKIRRFGLVRDMRRGHYAVEWDKECAELGQLAAFQPLFERAKHSYWRAWEVARQAFTSTERLDWSNPEFSNLSKHIGEIEDVLPALQAAEVYLSKTDQHAVGEPQEICVSRRSLQVLRDEFVKKAGNKLSCCLVEFPVIGKAPDELPPVDWLSDEDTYKSEQLGTPYRMFKYDLDRPPPRLIDPGGFRTLYFSGPVETRLDFLPLAGEAGRLAASLPKSSLPSSIALESLDAHRDHFRWCFLLFDLAWAGVKESPLRATERWAWTNGRTLPLAELPKLRVWNGSEWGRDIAELAASFPDPPSWFSIIGDLWRASIYAIDYLSTVVEPSLKKPEDATAENRELEFAHSPDFRSVRWFGATYTFTENQAPRVGLLWQNWEKGTPDVGRQALLDAVEESSGQHIAHVFRDCPAWGTMIVSAKKGSYRLRRPTDSIPPMTRRTSKKKKPRRAQKRK